MLFYEIVRIFKKLHPQEVDGTGHDGSHFLDRLRGVR